MSAHRRIVATALLAVLGVVLAAAITWGTSQLVSQKIGLSSEPLTAGQRLLPQSLTKAPAPKPTAPKQTSTGRTRTVTTTVTTTVSAAPAPAPTQTAPPATTQPPKTAAPPAEPPRASGGSDGVPRSSDSAGRDD